MACGLLDEVEAGVHEPLVDATVAEIRGHPANAVLVPVLLEQLVAQLKNLVVHRDPHHRLRRAVLRAVVHLRQLREPHAQQRIRELNLRGFVL